MDGAEDFDLSGLTVNGPAAGVVVSSEPVGVQFWAAVAAGASIQDEMREAFKDAASWSNHGQSVGAVGKLPWGTGDALELGRKTMELQAARIRELEAQVGELRAAVVKYGQRATAIWEHLPDVAAPEAKAFPARALRVRPGQRIGMIEP